jgi:putative lipase involved disintegration of autophagic bodies
MGLLAKITSLPLKIADTVLLQCVKVKAVGMRAGECYVASYAGRIACLRKGVLQSDTSSSSGEE